MVKDREAWRAAVHGVAESWTELSNQTTTTFICSSSNPLFPCYFNAVYVCVLTRISPVRLFANPWTVAHQAPLFMILQARILEWVVMPSSRGSSRPRDQTHFSYVSYIGSQVLYH